MSRLLDAALERAVTLPSSAIHSHVDQLRRKNPEASPAQLIALLEKEYLLIVQGSGGAVGAAAAAPAVGTGVAFTLTAADVGTFFAASAAFSLAVASVHGIEVQDADRRRALLLATILGESGAKAVVESGAMTGLRGMRVGQALLTRMPTGTIARVNNRLTRRLVRRQLAKHSGVAVGRMVPFGVGAVVGIAGARALGRTVIDGAREAFGPAPAAFTTSPVRVVETGKEPQLLSDRPT
ncbi:hypothetical protein [Cellulomonas sp. NPDC089187]|uniref:hypothetical protein n=1 Tax=Cellulomonas sp. NPDC089187 TaxID=3154970 RepID=UPI00341F5651